jgi:hypothetical protein
MNWIKLTNEKSLRQGSVCLLSDGEFVVVGGINTSFGSNDEFKEEVLYYTEHYCEDINNIITKCKENIEVFKTQKELIDSL